MTDDMPEGDLPYLEMLYKFAYGKKSYYDLQATRHVEPKETDRMRSEEEAPTDRHDRMRMLIWRGRQCLPERGRAFVPLRLAGGHCP